MCLTLSDTVGDSPSKRQTMFTDLVVKRPLHDASLHFSFINIPASLRAADSRGLSPSRFHTHRTYGPSGEPGPHMQKQLHEMYSSLWMLQDITGASG